MLQTVMFDLDGTLLDTAADFATVLNAQRDRHGLEPLPFPVIRAAVSNGARALVSLGFTIGEDEPGFQALREELLALYSEHIADQTRLFEGMDEVLAELERRGLPWGVVTNKPSAYTEPLLRRLALHERCAVAICPDHVEHRKPHPQSLLLACATVGADPAAALYVGDHRRDIETGRNAGSRTVACRYGYLGAEDNATDWQADHVIDHPLQLLEILESL